MCFFLELCLSFFSAVLPFIINGSVQRMNKHTHEARPWEATQQCCMLLFIELGLPFFFYLRFQSIAFIFTLAFLSLKWAHTKRRQQ